MSRLLGHMMCDIMDSTEGSSDTKTEITMTMLLCRSAWTLFNRYRGTAVPRSYALRLRWHGVSISVSCQPMGGQR